MSKQGIQKVKKEMFSQMISEFWNSLIFLEDDRIKETLKCGSYRRGVELLNDLDLLIVTSAPEDQWGGILDNISTIDSVATVPSIGTKKATMILDNGIQIDINVTNQESKPFMVLHATGSPFFNIALRSRAKKMGFKLNEKGLFEDQENVGKDFTDERQIFLALGLEYVVPPCRSVEHGDWSTVMKLFNKYKLKDGGCNVDSVSTI